MCNDIHSYHQSPPRKRGKGYKIFSRHGDNLVGAVGALYTYDEDDITISWKCSPATRGVGFCLFFTKKEALRAFLAWRQIASDAVLHHIYFEEAFVKQEEAHFLTGYTFQIGLCKRFRILEEVKVTR